MPGMIVCPETPAVNAGLRMLQNGGNAVDAAVATAFAQCVTNPIGCGIGGFATISIHLNNRKQTFGIHGPAQIGSKPMPDEFRSAYYGRANMVGRFLIEGDINQFGYQSIMIPGIVAALTKAFHEFGSGHVTWPEVLGPAIQLAKAGFAVYPYLEKYYWFGGPDRPGYPDARRKLTASKTASHQYLKDDRYYLTGELLVQEAYGETLDMLASAGAESFYRGEVARKMLADFETHGALITAADLENYQPYQSDSIMGSYRGYTLMAPPPPCHGVEVIQMLNILEGYDLSRLSWNSADYVDLLSRVMCQVFADRAEIIGDPGFVTVPVEKLISKQYAAEQREQIENSSPHIDSERNDLYYGESGGHTTHVSVIDEWRNVVSLTHSIGSVAGSGVVTPGLGFLYNNLLGHFSPLSGRPDSIEPGKRMEGGSPIIVFSENGPFMAIGSSGGSRLVSAIVQSLVNVIDYSMSIQAAVSTSRFHSEKTGVILIEPELFSQIGQDLISRDYELQVTTYMGCNQAIMIDQDQGTLLAGTDPRGGQGLALYV